MRLQQIEKNTPACLWMQAGVVNKKKCHNDFLCSACRFDRALRKVCLENQENRKHGMAAEKKRDALVFWKEKLKKKPLAQRPCIHHMKGHINFKACNKAYNCLDCEFDQYFHDQFKVYTILKPVKFSDINGVFLPAGYYLHPGHTWLKIEDKNNVCIGIDDFASRILGEFTTIQTPLMGKQLFKGSDAIHAFRNQHKASFVSPVSGVITQINPRVGKNPELINHDPYVDGWIMRIYSPDLKNDLKQLMFMDTSKSFMDREVSALFDFLEQETQLAAADGGKLDSDLFGSLPGISWENLLDKFIRKDL